jgi:hypothetical protein
MATRGYENFTATDVAQLQNKNAPAKPAKYRNVKCVADGQTFDSRREADYWLLLKAREQLGEITGLRRQVRFPLCCQDSLKPDLTFVVCFYVADFVYEANGIQHVIDAKGVRTRMYQLKKKWLELQTGTVIQEV